MYIHTYILQQTGRRSGEKGRCCDVAEHEIGRKVPAKDVERVDCLSTERKDLWQTVASETPHEF
jgi:hypothetical protein